MERSEKWQIEDNFAKKYPHLKSRTDMVLDLIFSKKQSELIENRPVEHLRSTEYALINSFLSYVAKPLDINVVVNNNYQSSLDLIAKIELKIRDTQRVEVLDDLQLYLFTKDIFNANITLVLNQIKICIKRHGNVEN